METVLFISVLLCSFVVLCLSFSIQNLNKDASTDTSFKTYTEPTATPFGHTMDSHSYSEGEGSTYNDAVPGPAVDSGAKGTDLFAPLILEEDSQEEPVLPQVMLTAFTRN